MIGLQGLFYRGGNDFEKPVFLDNLTFGTFANDGCDFIDTQFGCFLQKPLEAIDIFCWCYRDM